MKPFVAWPGWRHLGYAALWMFLVNILFAIVYSGSDWITAQRETHFRLFAQGELAIPLWPWAIVIYDSLYLLLLLAPFVLRTPESFRHLAGSAIVTIVAAGVCFLMLPAELGFAPSIVNGSFKAIFEASDRLNLDYNLVPSLHVALAVLCLQSFWSSAGAYTRALLALWGASLAASTLLTHQHHILDVATGAALAVLAFQSMRRLRHVE